MPPKPDIEHTLARLLSQQILVLDGAMGTMVQRHRLDEADFRGERFKHHPRDLRGDNDLLVLVRPFLDAGDPAVAASVSGTPAPTVAARDTDGPAARPSPGGHVNQALATLLTDPPVSRSAPGRPAVISERGTPPGPVGAVRVPAAARPAREPVGWAILRRLMSLRPSGRSRRVRRPRLHSKRVETAVREAARA